MYESNFVFYTPCAGVLRGKMQMLKIQDPSYYITTLLTSSFLFLSLSRTFIMQVAVTSVSTSSNDTFTPINRPESKTFVIHRHVSCNSQFTNFVFEKLHLYCRLHGARIIKYNKKKTRIRSYTLFSGVLLVP